MTAVLEKFGVRVPYPENWIVEEGANPHWPESFSIVSPQGAFWSLSIHGGSENLPELAAVVLNAIREEYEEVEAEAVRESIAGTDLIGFRLSFFCLDLLIQAECRAFSLGNRKFVVLYQGEDRDFSRQLAVFEAMTRSVVDRELAERISHLAP